MDTLFRREESEVLRGFCHSEEWACRCAAEGHMAADAAGAKALVGVIKIIKGHHYDKTREPPWRAMEKRHPPLVAPPPPFPQLRWWDYGCSALCYIPLQENIERFYSPPE